MNPLICHHPPEHQRVGINHALREIDHECALCGHVETQTLGSVSAPQKDLWQATIGDNRVD